jgi:hypothetical protein
MSPPDEILGLETEVLERFLQFLVKEYPIADKANYYLERQRVSGINIAITNQRDMLSHLVTLLTDRELTLEEKIGQVANAEEHLRRSVVETYAKAVALETKTALDNLNDYKRLVIPHAKNPAFSTAPAISAILKDLEEIEKLRQVGRAAKSQNAWNEEWVKGLNSYSEAFEKARRLNDTLDTLIHIGRQINDRREAIRYLLTVVVVSAAIPYLIVMPLINKGELSRAANLYLSLALGMGMIILFGIWKFGRRQLSEALGLQKPKSGQRNE